MIALLNRNKMEDVNLKYLPKQGGVTTDKQKRESVIQ